MMQEVERDHLPRPEWAKHYQRFARFYLSVTSGSVLCMFLHSIYTEVYGSDPRRIQYAGSETDGLSVDYKAKYTGQLQVMYCLFWS